MCDMYLAVNASCAGGFTGILTGIKVGSCAGNVSEVYYL